MKSERLNQLTALLVNHDQIAAEELARRLGVSVRTIYRDIETLSTSGVPIVSASGKGGGYGLVPGYRIDRSVMKTGEWGPVVAGLKGLSSLVEDRSLEATLEKVRALAPHHRSTFLDCLFLEAVPGQREQAALSTVRQALDRGESLDLGYRGTDGQTTDRRVDPLAVVFQWGSWFLYAWCHRRQDFRLFKLLRIQRARLTGHRADDHLVDLESRPWRKEWETDQFAPVVLRVFPPAQDRVEEEFAPDQIETQPDGTWLVRVSLPPGHWVGPWLMGFGGEVEVLAPEALRQDLARRGRVQADRNSGPPPPFH